VDSFVEAHGIKQIEAEKKKRMKLCSSLSAWHLQHTRSWWDSLVGWLEICMGTRVDS
jgi:hypothetical protein